MKKAFISGATHGIGKATAEVLLKNGWEVYGCASNRNDVRGMEMEKNYENFHFQYADVSNEREISNFFSWCGRLDAAFNNAGVGCKPSSVHLLDTRATKRILDINLLGTALCMKYECQLMLKGKGGVIVNNSSVSAWKAATGANLLYSASKAGILRLTAEAAVMKEYNGKIRFFCIAPGYIETRMTATDNKDMWVQMLPSHKVGRAVEVGELVAKIFEHSEKFDSGQFFHVNGGGILI